MSNSRLRVMLSYCRDIGVCRLLLREAKRECVDLKTLKFNLKILMRTKMETPYIYNEICNHRSYLNMNIEFKVRFILLY